MPFTLTTAAINMVLAHAARTIVIDACGSAGLTATYNQLDGWASKFLEAGAAAFVGSLWAVPDGTARKPSRSESTANWRTSSPTPCA